MQVVLPSTLQIHVLGAVLGWDSAFSMFKPLAAEAHVVAFLGGGWLAFLEVVGLKINHYIMDTQLLSPSLPGPAPPMPSWGL